MVDLCATLHEIICLTKHNLQKKYALDTPVSFNASFKVLILNIEGFL